MFISKTNVLAGLSPTLVEGSSGDLPSNVTDPDFSLNYTASDSRLQMQFGSVPNCNYVAVVASNFDTGTGSVTVRNGTSSATIDSIRGQYAGARSHVLMFVFEEETIGDLRVVVDSKVSNNRPTLSYVAAGQAILVPNRGETAGYERQWQTRGIKSRVQSNAFGSPIASLVQREALKGKLNLPNMLRTFTEGEWQDFLDHSAEQPFFICEQSTVVEYAAETGYYPQASYICFEPKFSAPKAHAQTRSLNNLTMQFKVYNGL